MKKKIKLVPLLEIIDCVCPAPWLFLFSRSKFMCLFFFGLFVSLFDFFLSEEWLFVERKHILTFLHDFPYFCQSRLFSGSFKKERKYDGSHLITIELLHKNYHYYLWLNLYNYSWQNACLWWSPSEARKGMKTSDWIFACVNLSWSYTHTNLSRLFSWAKKIFRTIRFLNKALLKSTSVIHQSFNFHLKTKVLHQLFHIAVESPKEQDTLSNMIFEEYT